MLCQEASQQGDQATQGQNLGFSQEGSGGFFSPTENGRLNHQFEIDGEPSAIKYGRWPNGAPKKFGVFLDGKETTPLIK